MKKQGKITPLTVYTPSSPELYPNAFTIYIDRQLRSNVNLLISFIEIPEQNKIIRQIYTIPLPSHNFSLNVGAMKRY